MLHILFDTNFSRIVYLKKFVSDDDFAKNIEKTLATILNKKEKEAAAVSGEEDKIEEKRGKKRKKGDKDRKVSKTIPNYLFTKQYVYFSFVE